RTGGAAGQLDVAAAGGRQARAVLQPHAAVGAVVDVRVEGAAQADAAAARDDAAAAGDQHAVRGRIGRGRVGAHHPPDLHLTAGGGDAALVADHHAGVAER